MRRLCALIATSITVIAVAVAATSSSAADATSAAAPAGPANGSCTHPTHPAMAPVSYAYASRTNAWRAHPTFEHVTPTTLPGGGKSTGTIGAVTIHTHQAAWYLILDARQVGDNCFVLLRLPAVKYANHRIGWVNRDVLSIARETYQVEIDLSARTVSLFRGAKLVLNAKAVVGKPSTPTPVSGRPTPFAFYDTKRADPNGFTGSWELATTADAPQDETLGRIGLHGRGGASLDDSLGNALSHGCVRVDNAVVDKVVSTIGIANLVGTPVVIVA